MAIPSALAQALAANQKMVSSAERSQYAETKEIWAQNSGSVAEEHPRASQLMSFGVSSALMFGAYNLGPGAVSGLRQYLTQSDSVQKWQLAPTSKKLNTIGDVLSADTGKDALKHIRAFGLQGLTDLTNLDYDTKANFWYSGLKKVEQSGLELPIFDNVIKLFTKATYLSDMLSYSVKRKGATTLNISHHSLGFTGRERTLDLYSNQLGIKRDVLDLLDHLVYEDGQVFAGQLQRDGSIIKRGKALSDKARLVDKGAFTEGLLTVIDPRLGMKDPHTGGTYAEKIGGQEGHILLSADVIDPNYKKIIENAEASGRLSPKGAARARNVANATVMTESYISMGLQRTSKLMSEMFNEAGSFLEYIAPNVKKNLYGDLYKNKLVPRMAHGHGMAMLGRYSMLASTIGLSLSAVNQVGYSLQNGNAVTSKVAGLAQTAGLAYLGGMLTKKAFKNSTAGTLIGGGLGLLGMAGVGPFANGPIPGIANVIARANELKAYVGEYSGLSWWRRQMNEMLPGGTTVTTALGVGVATAAVGVTAHRFLGRGTIVENKQRVQYLKARFQDSNISLREARETIARDASAAQRIRQVHREELRTMSPAQQAAAREKLETDLRKARNLKSNKLTEKQISKMEEEFLSYTDKLAKSGEHGVLANRIGEGVDSSKLVKLAQELEDFTYEKGRQQIIASTRGGSIGGAVERIGKAIKQAPRGKAIAYGAMAVGTAYYMLTSGMGIGSIETPNQVRELNQGKRLEAVRRGQKWEMGQTGYEGDDILYYRPTLTARLASGAAQAGASGNRGALEELILKNFTYKLEREEYYRRPAPITGAAFDQIPFLQPIIRPIADLIKAPKLMHVGEWARMGNDGNPYYLERSTGLEEIPQPGTGGTSMPAPVSPYSTGRIVGEFWQQTTSLAGLVGYYGRTLKLAMTGAKGFGDQRDELESSSDATSMASRFYDEHGGGSFLGVPMTSEVIRRFLFKPEVKQYNPIQNEMPSWLPDSFKYGNQYASLRQGGGEYRMPGEGYAALHPELKGVNPQDYTLMHRLNILGDLAPYSPQYKAALKGAELMKQEGDMTEEELRFFYRHKQMISERKNKREYDSYKFKPSTYDTLGGKVTSVDESTMSFTIEGYGGRFGVAGITNDASALISDYNLSIKDAAKQRQKNASAFKANIQVGDTLTVQVPASMGAAVGEDGIIKAAIRNNFTNINKEIREEGNFAKDDSAISEYAMTNQIGRTVARAFEATTHFANRMAQPIEHLMMFGAAPVNKLLPYRDVLEDYEAREVYGTEMKSWEDPVGSWIAPALKTAMHNYLGVDFESPYLQKKRDAEEYFDKLKFLKYNNLAQAASLEGQSGLAEQYRNISRDTTFASSGFVSQDRLANVLGGVEGRFAQGFANEINPNRQEDIINALPGFKQKAMKGFYLNQDLDAINRAATAGPMSTTGMDYAADLIELKENQGYEGIHDKAQVMQERQKELNSYFQYKTLPKVDWIGFNPAVDLEDVKLKYIESEGMDYHDFGIYPSRASYIARKPYITQESVQGLNNFTFNSPIQAMADVAKGYGGYGVNSYNIQGPNRSQSFVNITNNQYHSLNPFE